MYIEAMKGVLWNLFLAFVPVGLAYLAAWLAKSSRRNGALRAPLAVVMLAWIGFLPNSCYLLTEWRHFLLTLDGANLYLQAQAQPAMLVTLAIYTAFYFCYSAVGMLAFTLALRPLARICKHFIPNTWLAAVPLFVLLSLGVYLGLVLRDNTWDLIVRPSKVWMDIVNAGSRPRLITMIFVFGAFLWFAFLTIDVWVDAVILRWRLWQVRGVERVE